MPSHKYLSGPRLDPHPITPTTSLVELVEHTFLAYNAARLREACGLYAICPLTIWFDATN